MFFHNFSLLIKCAYVSIIILSVSSCGIKPVVVHDSSLYLGGFKNKKVTIEQCVFSSVEGVGIKLAFLTFSLGYFNHNKLYVNIDEGVCESDIATVQVMLDSNIDNKIDPNIGK
ncbi:hypothetical protein [Colwellia sp. Arc7-D]|uniref:hypothetical protein n=1 Tax=Colwellia sp. Arc7-D TaxID=2161872 RepID=UPI000D3BFB4B|nr:hypothetical protein [Colwellia sp. Arc7-D]AWB57189.1 hypothetical protein DBO93_06280 [Colwellia sp. Arc7-D]